MKAMTTWIHELYARGVRVIVVDHFHFLVKDEESVQEIRATITAIKNITRQYADLDIFLIVQPKVLAEGQAPSLRTMRGGAAIGQAIDTLLTVVSVAGHPDITQYEYHKVRSHGRVSKKHWVKKKIYLEYHHENMRMLEVEYEPPTPQQRRHDHDE